MKFRCLACGHRWEEVWLFTVLKPCAVCWADSVTFDESESCVFEHTWQAPESPTKIVDDFIHSLEGMK